MSGDAYDLDDVATRAQQALDLAADAAPLETLGKVVDQLEQAAAALRELREDLDAAESRIGRLHQRIQVLEAEHNAT